MYKGARLDASGSWSEAKLLNLLKTKKPSTFEVRLVKSSRMRADGVGGHGPEVPGGVLRLALVPHLTALWGFSP